MPPDQIIAAIRQWVNQFVIGLNLCPFAKRVEEAGRIRYVVTNHNKSSELLIELEQELKLLVDASRETHETTLLICPQAPEDFLDFNDLVVLADETLGYSGIIQIIGFHPQFRYGDTTPDAVENHTNRSPYPMIHLLREESISEVTTDPTMVDTITQRNTLTLKGLGKIH